MKILLAPDKFKGSLTAQEVCDTIENAINTSRPDIEVVKLPLADGGEGFSEAIIGDKTAQKHVLTVNDPIGRWCSANFYSINKLAIIEMANASGLKLLSNLERNPLKASTYGTGELIYNALQKGCDEIIIGIGGSATNDAGMGMAAALGYRFFDKNGNKLQPSGENLIKVTNIEEPIKKLWQYAIIKVACDVENTLYGIAGAAYVFGSQKGANAQQMKDLDEGLRSFSRVVNGFFKKNFHFIPGSGAAGGLGYGLIAFLGAKLHSGIDLILEANNFESKLESIDLVITGEGKMDSQTLQGKVVAGVARKAKERNIPVYSVCGVNELTESQLFDLGIQRIISLKTEDISSDFAIKNAKTLMKKGIVELFANQ